MGQHYVPRWKRCTRQSHELLLSPTNWLVEDALDLAQVAVSGTLFCPKNGEVSIIPNGLGTEWAG